MSKIRSRILAPRNAGHLLLVLLLTLPVGAAAANLVSVTVNPTNIVSGSPLEETVTLDGPAPAGGVYVSVMSDTPSVVTTFSIGLAAGETSQSVVLPPTGYVAPATGAVFVTVTASDGVVIKTATVTVTPREPVRGVSGDLWADVILGKPDFGEVTFNEVTSRRVFNPGGVTVDRSVRPNRLYVFDATNSRVLGLSHLGTCTGGANSGQNCTTNSDCPGSSCAVQEGRGADLVLGQPSFTRSACNGDGAFQRFPLRAPASAATLCGVPEEQMSISEGVIYANMAVDSAGNLYVPDFLNHRVLRYDSPFTTPGTSADDVWGQTDFVQNECNRGNGLASPDAQSLCFAGPNNSFTAGVDIDSVGNLWVADHQNNRVLRFPRNAQTGHPSHQADLVLGQPGFNSSGQGSGLNQMWGPAAVRVDSGGIVYVADLRNNRVLIFSPPISSGMTAGLLDYTVNGHSFFEPSGLEIDPSGGLWVNDWLNNHLLLFVGGVLQKILFTDVPTSEGCGGSFAGDIYPGYFVYADGSSMANWRMCESGGSIGIDSDGNVFASGKEAQDVWRFPAPIPTPTPGTAHSADTRIFKPYQFGIQNEVGPAGFQSANGVAVAAGQLIVADGKRLLFWDNPPNLTSGQPADGYVGQQNPTSLEGWQVYGRIREDGSKRLWAIHSDEILVYSLPLYTGETPAKTFVSPLPVLGGGTLTWDENLLIGGIQPVGAGDKVWVADPYRNRVFRIRDAWTSPTVDIVLGQTNLSETDCNQGRGMNSGGPTRDSLCYPGAVRLDPQGNLYVSDDSAEVQGNFRLLEYDATLFPDSPTTALFATPASRVFGTGGSFTLWPDGSNEFWSAAFEPAFTPDGQMVDGGNGYLNPRFPYVYSDPLGSQRVSMFLNDFYSWPGAATFDANGNLYVTDGNRGRLLIYLDPLAPKTTTYTLTVTKTGGGGGTVTSSPPGINCGTACSQPYDSGTVVTLSPVPDGASRFSGWSGDADCADGVVTMNAARTCTATFVPAPDLIISALSVSATGGAGLAISVRDTTRNLPGTAPAGASTTKFFLSSDTTLDAGDTFLGARAIRALAPGAASTGSTPLTIPAGTAWGNYYVIARADADSVVPESVETNNTAFAPLAIGPDLIVLNLSAPKTGGAGLAISVKDTTRNQPRTAPAGASRTSFYLSTETTLDVGDTLLGSRPVPGLAAGAASSGSTSLTIPAGTAPGSYYIIAKADGEDALFELNETNNTKATPIRVNLPDLVVSALSFRATLGTGRSFLATNTTRNQPGGGPAPASTTRFYLSANATWDASDTPVGSQPIGVLNPGASETHSTSLTIPANQAPGTYYIIAKADADNLIAETLETNNTRARVVRITP